MPEKKCVPLSFNERSAIYTALREKKESIIESGQGKRDKGYVTLLKKLMKKFP